MCCLFPEFWECLHCWNTARYWYEDEISLEHPRNTNAQRNWIQRYTDEELQGLTLLQREKRLKEQMSGEFTFPQKENQLSDTPPKYEETGPSLEQQLADTQEQYWVHQRKLLEIESGKPVKGMIIGLWNMQRRVKNGQGRTLDWEEARGNCARTGGCCGRDCGCCSKPLKEFMMPTRSGRQEKSEIYGHCTEECSCCIRSRGFYRVSPENERRASHSSETE